MIYAEHLQAAKRVLGAYAPLTLAAAVDVAYLLGIDMEIVIYGRKGISLRQLAHCFRESKMAREVHVKFFGGPPGRGTWHRGSVETFLLDNLLVYATRFGWASTNDRLLAACN
jgi:hypothetical protein